MGGALWTPSILPDYDTSGIRLSITSFDFADTLVGYVTLQDGRNPGSNTFSKLWKTADGGFTWREEGKFASLNQVVVVADKPIVGYRGGLAFKDKYVGVETRAFPMDQARLMSEPDYGLGRYSTDGGVTWGTAAGTEFLDESWGTTYLPAVDRFFVCKESPDAGMVYTSSDYGRSWQFVSTLNPSDPPLIAVTGDIKGAGNSLYVQGINSREAKEGFYRSDNFGLTWRFVGGPGAMQDTRFSVPYSCNGRTVVGFGKTSVWITTDGGDGTLSHPISTISSFIPELRGCTSGDSIKIHLTHAGCDTLVLKDVRILKPATGTNLVSTALPIRLTDGESYQSTLQVDPNALLGVTAIQVRITGYYEHPRIAMPFDTVISLSIEVKRSPPSIASINELRFAESAVCGVQDTSLELLNQGCDFLAVKGLSVSGEGFSIDPVPPIVEIASGGHMNITVRFDPPSPGSYDGRITYVGEHQGVEQVFSVPLHAIGSAGMLNTDMLTSISFPPITICTSNIDTQISVRNAGCDTVVISEVSLSGSSDYSLATNADNLVVPPDSTFTFRVGFTPLDKGVRNGTMTITWTDELGNDPRDITLTLNATVTDGTRALTSSLTAIDFGETNICEERDSVVRFTNTGCDTVTITDATIDKNFTLDADLPITLIPDQSIELPIETLVDTTGKPTVLTGVFTIASNAVYQLPPITLTRRLYYPTKLRIEVVDEASGKAGDEARFRIVLEGEVPSRLTSLHFDFLHNNDNLSFESLEGQGLSIISTQGETEQRQRFTLSPVRAGVLGEVTFKAYLAVAEQTTLSFDNITFDAAGLTVAPECIAMIADSGSSFSYLYTCGDDLVRSALRGERLIKSLTPNPAQNEIRIELTHPDAFEIVMFDVLGTEVLRTDQTRLDVSTLPSGRYYVRVRTANAIQTRSVLIER